MSTVADRVKSLPNMNNITQPSLADLLGIKRSTLANWEIGRIEPDLEVLCKIADCFNVTVDYLLSRMKWINLWLVDHLASIFMEKIR